MTKTKDKIPPLCREGAEPDRSALFITLRKVWMDKIGPSAALARQLDIPRQWITPWINQDSSRQPPWWVVLRVCHDLCVGIAIEPDQAKLYRLPEEAVGGAVPPRDSEPDRYRIFAMLRERWKLAPGNVIVNGEERRRTYTALAEILGVPKQVIAMWATGSGGKSPAPWWVLMRLCDDLGLGIAVEPNQIRLYRSRPE